MERQPILVAVDQSPEAAAAAEFGVRLAQAAGTRCQLVHAVRDPWAAAFLAEVSSSSTEFTRLMFGTARAQLESSLAGHVPASLVRELIVQAGRPVDVIAQQARAINAQLIVLGGKHHSALGRWFGGSTSLNVVRSTAIPVLVTTKPQNVQRVLVALDTSGAAAQTFDAARYYAHIYGAELRALSIIEPLPPMPEGTPLVDPAPYLSLCRDAIEAELRPLVDAAGAELVIQMGPTAATIEHEAEEWNADLVVMGSHGKSWSERLILGSVTERLLNDLPASLVVVPVSSVAPVTAPAAPNLVPAIA
jgi:nucleotide-binding universal stress UspA family protein